MIINVMSLETLNTYETANIKVISPTIQKRKTKMLLVLPSEQLEGKFHCMALKLELRFYATTMYWANCDIRYLL